MKHWLSRLVACRSQLHVFLEGTYSSNTSYALGQTPVTQFSSVILLKCVVTWWKPSTVTFYWLLQSTSGLSSSPFPSVTALAQSWSRWMGGKSFFRGSYDGYILPEGHLLRLEESLARDQRTRPRSCGEKRKFSEIRKKLLLKAEVGEGVALNAGAILSGWSWRVSTERRDGGKWKARKLFYKMAGATGSYRGVIQGQAYITAGENK